MSEDEAFIRAIVDNPGDEAPRLVYADWLEERGDLRGAYLRAEQEAVKTGDSAEIERLAVGLDPVWVARVTLPPLGACCENIDIRGRGPIINGQDIERFEQQFGITLPHDYRAFLLNYNGGLITSYPSYELPDGEVFSYGEHVFYSLNSRSAEGEGRNLESWASSRGEYVDLCLGGFAPEAAVANWFMQFITVGVSADQQFGLLLGVVPPVLGLVWYLDYNSGLYSGFLNGLGTPDAASFSQLLSTLP